MQEKLEKGLALKYRSKWDFFFLFFLYHQTVDELERGSSCRISMTCQHTNPLLICTDFLKFPFRHSFQTGIKIQLETNWKFFSVVTEFFFFQFKVRTEKKISKNWKKKFSINKLILFFSSNWIFFSVLWIIQKTSGDQQGVCPNVCHLLFRL